MRSINMEVKFRSNFPMTDYVVVKEKGHVPKGCCATKYLFASIFKGSFRKEFKMYGTLLF